MKKPVKEIIDILSSHLDSSRYKIYEDSIEYFEDYILIHYQSKSIVNFNIPDDDMIYGIGTLVLRKRDKRVFEVHSDSNLEKQIEEILK